MTACLCMIVKNEERVIERALRSAVAAGIDYWVIADTGSTDATPDIIRRVMGDARIPGVLSFDPWFDFATNRSLVMERATGRGDWLVCLDADEELEGSTRSIPDAPNVDAWAVHLVLCGETRHTMFRVFRGSLRWTYQYEIHEHVILDGRVCEFYPSLTIKSHADGARSRNPRKWLDDAEFIMSLPPSPRNLIHAAHSYREAGMFHRARELYLERVGMGGGMDEELWVARFWAARLACALDLPSARDELLECYNERPKRAEPLLELARLSTNAGKDGLAFLYAGHAMSLVEPQQEMFTVDIGAYGWKRLKEFATACAGVGLTRAARQVILDMQKAPGLPARAQDWCEQNLKLIDEHEKGGKP